MTDAELSRGASPARASDAIVAVLLGALALGLRALPWPAVFTGDGIRLVGPDAHYHLRRIQWSVEHFPAVLMRDAYVRFPDGGQPIWTPTFDWTIAALARLLVGRGNEAGVEAVAVWVPPVLGALTVAVVYGLGRRFFGSTAGWVAATTLALLPAHIAWSQIGFVDHHVAVALLAAALLAVLLETLRESPDGGFGLALPAGLGLCMGLALLVWPGCLLHVALVQACLVVRVAAARSRERAVARAARAAVAHGTAFLLVAPFAMASSWSAWGPLSPVVLSAFQPLWLGLPAVGLGGCALAWRGRAGATPGRRGLWLGAAFGLPAATSLAFPAVREGAVEAAVWLFRAEVFQAVVAESLPLFSDGEGFSAQRAHAQLTPLVWGTPLGVAVLASRGRCSPAHAVLALFAAAFFAATLAQYRFANSFSVFFALGLGACFALARDALAHRSPAARRMAVVAVVAAALALLAPLGRTQLRALATAKRAFAGEAVRPEERVTHHADLVDTARWLRDHSPTTSGWLDTDAPPEYGVLTAWGDGHVTRYVARRPVVQDNFGDDVGRLRFDQAESYFSASSEADALQVAETLGARYVLARGSGSGHAAARYASDSMLVHLYRLRGSAGRLRSKRPGEAPVYLPGLTRHRLVYESPDLPDEEGGRYKLFEIVAGARLEGRAAPGAVVEAQLVLREPPGGRSLDYRAHTRADARGSWSLRLPYPSEPFEGRYSADGPYRIRSGERVRAVNVRERDVATGARVEGPDLGD